MAFSVLPLISLLLSNRFRSGREESKEHGSQRKEVTMEETIKIKIQPLTAEAFRPYGQVLEGKHLVYPEVEDGRVAMEMLHFPSRPAKPFEQLAIHFSYNQTFIPLKGSLVLVVAPPPRNRDEGPEGYELDYDRIAAFVMELGDAAIVDKGTWHTIVALGAER